MICGGCGDSATRLQSDTNFVLFSGYSEHAVVSLSLSGFRADKAMHSTRGSVRGMWDRERLFRPFGALIGPPVWLSVLASAALGAAGAESGGAARAVGAWLARSVLGAGTLEQRSSPS